MEPDLPFHGAALVRVNRRRCQAGGSFSTFAGE